MSAPVADSPDARIADRIDAACVAFYGYRYSGAQRMAMSEALMAADAALVSESQSSPPPNEVTIVNPAMRARIDKILAGAQSTEPAPSDAELDAIEAWGEKALRQYGSYPESTYGLCDYLDALPTKSIRSQMLSLVSEVRRGRLVAANLAEAAQRVLDDTMTEVFTTPIVTAALDNLSAALSEYDQEQK